MLKDKVTTLEEAKQLTYGGGAGSMKATYRPGYCAEAVTQDMGRWTDQHQCGNKALRNGLYCKIHTNYDASRAFSIWKVDKHGDEPEEGKAVAETDKCFIMRSGRRVPKQDSWGQWYRSKGEAVRKMIEREQDRIRTAERHIATSNKILAKMAAMAKKDRGEK